jgi:hypothetical protein
VKLSLGAQDNEEDLRKALAGVDLVFCNTNSFILGIKNEIYWGMRIFELSVQAGVKHFIWSSLDNFMFDTKYTDSLRAGHYYGKAAVEQWLYSIPQKEDSTRWSILTTGPYVEMLSDLWVPKKDREGTYLFEVPIEDGAIPFVHLDDLGPYVHWIFSHIDQSAGLNLKVAIDHVHLHQIPEAFTKVTGKQAKAVSPSLESWFQDGAFAGVAERKIGASTAGHDDDTLLTYRQNFSNWIRIYRQSAENKGLLRRDYAFLDEVLPGRVRTLEQWMRKAEYTGEWKEVLKNRRRDPAS